MPGPVVQLKEQDGNPSGLTPRQERLPYGETLRTLTVSMELVEEVSALM
jgi:hypothetical protein